MRCARQTALERQDLSRTYLAHHELESVVITIIMIMIRIMIMIMIIMAEQPYVSQMYPHNLSCCYLHWGRHMGPDTVLCWGIHDKSSSIDSAIAAFLSASSSLSRLSPNSSGQSRTEKAGKLWHMINLNRQGQNFAVSLNKLKWETCTPLQCPLDLAHTQRAA